MAIITYPLDGIDYNASNAETYLCTRVSGVFSADGQFQARVYGNRQVEISSGLAWIQNTTFKGKSVCNTSSVIIDVPLADGSLPRKDRIVLRFDKAENRSKIILIEGEPSGSARAPEIKRTEQIYDLGLCVVDVPPSSLTVLQQHITSTLLDESVCGLMRDGVTGIPTAQLQEQVYALIEDLKKAIDGALDGSEYLLKSLYKGSAEGVVKQADKTTNALTLQTNGANAQTFDGSSAKTFNVTPSSIGAFSKTDIIPVANGGTGASNGRKGLKNLGLLRKSYVITTNKMGYFSLSTPDFGQELVGLVGTIYNTNGYIRWEEPTARGANGQVLNFDKSPIPNKAVRIHVIMSALTDWN